jgi:hypothetical protein
MEGIQVHVFGFSQRTGQLSEKLSDQGMFAATSELSDLSQSIAAASSRKTPTGEPPRDSDRIWYCRASPY